MDMLKFLQEKSMYNLPTSLPVCNPLADVMLIAHSLMFVQ